MKKLMILVIAITFSLSLIAQEKGLFIQSVSIAPGAWGDFDSDFTGTEGLGITADATANFHDHLFTLYVSALQEVSVFNNDNDTAIAQVGAYYGREFNMTPWFRMEGHVGPSIVFNSYSNDTTNFNRVNETALGYGGRAKFLFYPTPSRRFGLGPHAQVNFNSVTSTGMVGFIFQMRFD